ncbi:MAG: copper-translocating P-type ATPase [Promethearchaeota archaeon]
MENRKMDHSEMNHSEMDHSKMDHSKMNHSEHHKMMIVDFRRRFIVSLFLTIPILILSPAIQNWLKYNIDFIGKDYVLLILSVIIYFYGGYPFLKGAIDELKKKLPGMMLLIGVAISVAFFYSIAIIFGLSGSPFFWELATLIDIMLLGHWIEMRSILGASQALEKLIELLPSEAHLIKDGQIIEVDLREIKPDDIVLVKPGEKIPNDGIVIKGASYVDESMLTGESIPILKEQGHKVIAGSINGDSSLEIKVTNTGENSYLAKVIKLVKEAQAEKSRTQRLADRAALYLTIISITVGVVTLIVWLMSSESIAFAIERMATVMVITCPHALGLAIPLVVAVSTSNSAKKGILIRNRTAFENSRRITTILFDKTGTLTEGKFKVNSIKLFKDNGDNGDKGDDNVFNEKDVIKIAAGLEQNSEHPIAVGILAKAKESQITLPEVKEFKAIKGRGVEGIIGGIKYALVSPNYLKELKIDSEFLKDDDTMIGTSVILIRYPDQASERPQVLARFLLSDKIRNDSAEAIEKLQKLGIKCYMVTGDNKKIAEVVSKELKLDGFFAEILPHQKLEIVKKFQEKREFVAMTGDGINDAPALAKADVGIAVGSGTDIAAETADIILVNSNPKDITSLINFGRATYKKMIQNLTWATGYNVFAIPLAAGVLYSIGIIISPAIGAVLMSLSTVIVAINAKLLQI